MGVNMPKSISFTWADDAPKGRTDATKPPPVSGRAHGLSEAGYQKFVNFVRSDDMQSIDVLVSFDTTGSMFPCLTQVRRYVDQTVKQLFKEIPEIRIGIISHGDYCDGDKVISSLDLTDDQERICRFVRNAPATGGGDAPEAYELVLNKARSMDWKSDRHRALVLIGDDEPHEVGYRCASHTNKLDWRNEAKLLSEMGVHVYSVQALGRHSSTRFYNDLAALTSGIKLNLEQFSEITDMLTAICFREGDRLQRFEDIVKQEKRGTPKLIRLIDILSGRKPTAAPKKSEHALDAVHPSRFQILAVDDDCVIKDFVQDNGLAFKKGRGFYEFTKSVKVQSYKEVVIQDRANGEMFSGDKAREILGIPVGRDAQVKPTSLTKYRGFIQSTSVNRKLLGGTAFLYEVDETLR